MASNFASLNSAGYLTSNVMVARMRLAIRDTIRTHAEMIRDYIQTEMKRQPKGGRPDVRADGTFFFRSAPGEVPAVDTGRLLGSIKIKYGRGGMSAEVGSQGNVPYAIELEEGRPGLQPRPFIAPAVNQFADSFTEAMKEAIAKSLT